MKIADRAAFGPAKPRSRLRAGSLILGELPPVSSWLGSDRHRNGISAEAPVLAAERAARTPFSAGLTAVDWRVFHLILS